MRARFPLPHHCSLAPPVLLALACLLLAPSVDAEPGCGHACRSGSDERELRVYAEQAQSRKETRAEREERWRLRDLERTTRGKVNQLERRLDRAERKVKSRERSTRYGSNDGQAGAHCMYGIDGHLIFAGQGSSCAATNDGSAVIPGKPPTTASTVAPAAPRQAGAAPAASTGCISGACSHGQGSFVWPDGSRYVGGFKDGKQHGQGSMVFQSGATYVGQWRAGQRSGQGTAMYPDGRVQSGRWAENRFVGESAPERIAAAKIRWPDLSKPAREVGGGEHDAAVVVGIESYAHVARIPGAERNASDWYRYLTKTRGIPADRIIYLLDADATREEMRHAAEEAALQVGKKGSLWFVFIGHGAPAPTGDDGLLIGFDAQQKARSLSTRSLARSELIRILESSPAEQVNVVLDACFSGRASGGEQLVAGLQPLVVTSSAPTSDPRITLMTAAHSDEYAGPLPGSNRPAFSYLVLGGLRGWADDDGNGRVEASELHEYVSAAMRALIRSRRQSPTLVGGEDHTLARSARESGPDIANLVLGVSSAAASAAD